MACAAVCAAVAQLVLQARDDRYVRDLAAGVVDRAHAQTPREKVLALREYVRASLAHRGAPYETRPFLRPTAGEILRSRMGFCGECARAFICLADAAGVHAQRLNLYGYYNHVVAVVELEPDRPLVVDAYGPPIVEDLEPLDRVMLRPQFRQYSTIHLEKVGLSSVIERLRLRMSPLDIWMEKPHWIRATAWFLLAFVLLATAALRGLRQRVRGRRSLPARAPAVPAEAPATT